MAYVLGLWYAAGHIYGDKIFDITLRAKDKYIIKQVARELNYKGELYDGVDKQAARINFSCVVIYRDIVALTNERKFPDVPEEYLSDFIRGFFDGKGEVTRIKGNRINTSFIYTDKAFLMTLAQILRIKANVKKGSYDSSSESIKFGTKDSLKIGNYIYKDNPELFLLRKRKKFY
jgi:hypothetical protein